MGTWLKHQIQKKKKLEEIRRGRSRRKRILTENTDEFDAKKEKKTESRNGKI